MAFSYPSLQSHLALLHKLEDRDMEWVSMGY